MHAWDAITPSPDIGGEGDSDTSVRLNSVSGTDAPDDDDDADGNLSAAERAAVERRAHPCLGFDADMCPQYPLPYGAGEVPREYQHSGRYSDGFVWGMGTSAYQIEGGYREGGRGASIWDTFAGADTVGMPGANCSYCCQEAPCPVPDVIIDKGASGNVACDHYRLWRSDVALMKSMGLKHYRFSISWPRVVPTGKIKDGISRAGLRFYSELIDGLLEAGVTPYVTLYHWDLPQGLLDPPRMQGWWSRDSETREPDNQILPHWLAYVDLCFKNFGDRVKTWVTFNEPWTFLFLGSGYGGAPGIPEYSDMQVDPWIGGHNVLVAHAEAVALYRRRYQPQQRGQIGISNNCDWREPASNSSQDVAAAERAVQFQLAWFMDPIFGEAGDYPPAMRKIYGDRLPRFTSRERQLLMGSADFIGLNHYGTGFASYDPDSEAPDGAYAGLAHSGDMPRAASPWLFGAAWGMRKLLRWIALRYGAGKPIMLTEGGWSLRDRTPAEATHDAQRVEYYANYTSELLGAVNEDGAHVMGYFAWSLLDNYEWAAGYQSRFGTIYVDFGFGRDGGAGDNAGSQPTSTDQWRQRKASSCWLEHLWRRNELGDPSDALLFSGCPGPANLHGTYESLKLQGCYRRIVLDRRAMSSADAAVHEVLGNGSAVPGEGCGPPSSPSLAPWPVRVRGGSIMMSVHGERGPSVLRGYWNSATSAVDWDDGDSWARCDPTGDPLCAASEMWSEAL